MLFVIIRIAFWLIVFIICALLIKKSKVIHKLRWSIIAVIVAVMMTTISALIPIENAFITFSSPESAYNYNNPGKATLIVDGEKSNFVVGANGDTDIYAIVPKANRGYKIGMGLDTKRINQTISDGITIYVYQYKNTDDYFITVMHTEGGSLNITDSHNSEFKYLEKSNSTIDKTFYTYYAYINNFNEQYSLTINGKQIELTK